MKRSLLKWELIGIGVIFLLGAAFHFVFESTGSLSPLGAFVPVNESVFEHLKMTFWPAIIWAAFSYSFIKSQVRNFIIAKAAALVVMPLIILILFYGYTAFTEENVIIDILIFFVAVACGQLLGYLLLKAHPLPTWLTGLSAFLIILLAVIYTVFTYYPPYVSIFMDSNTGSYGIPVK
jgi:hypothetical protein